MEFYRRTAALPVGLAAVALVPALYWPALHATYRIDDYAWLSLANALSHGRSLWWALFLPAGAGSVRPLGERLWFLLSSTLFGSNPVPLHSLAWCLQAINVVLVINLGRRLLGSPLAASLAGALWAVNSTLVGPMIWASAFNEVLFTCLFLSAFHALLRWVESGRTTWLLIHLGLFVLALGTLETAVTFPAVAAAYLLLTHRKRWRAVLPSLAGSLVFVVLHLWTARLPNAGPYKMTLGWGIVANFAHYWAAVLGPQEYYRTHGGNAALALFGTLFLSAAALLWVAARARRNDWIPLFGVAWFVIALAPLLPLLNHFTFYYTFLPSIGLAWIAGGALALARSRPAKLLAVACAVVYAICEVPSTVFIRNWDLDRSLDVARREAQMREGVRQIRQQQREGPVFLTGIDTEQFWWGICYGELYREGFAGLHVMPDAGEHGIAIPPREWCYRQDFQLSPSETRQIVAAGSGHVYDLTRSPPKLLAFDSVF